MELLTSISQVRKYTSTRRAASGAGRLALVPTMGALHPGHLSLVEQARALVGPQGTVLASIFVNPLQFGPSEDFSKYPRPLEEDLRLCREAGVHAVFHPPVEEMYARDRSVYVDETLLSQGLCGGARPGHFRGVCTVVLKLFNIVQPDVAVFGRKDYQQLAVIRRMVRDLCVPVEIVAGETVREADGLALSSRNKYLSAEERREALALSRALRAGADAVLAGGSGNKALTREEILQIMRAELEISPLAKVDYLEIVDPQTLQPAEHPKRGDVLLGAAFFGTTRLIDNMNIN